MENEKEGLVMEVIKISEVFSDSPGGRLIIDGKYSGEEFRQKHLEPCVLAGVPFLVDLDGTFGYATSFLDEAFGGLARKYTKAIVLGLINFKSDEDPELIDRITGYIKQ